MIRPLVLLALATAALGLGGCHHVHRENCNVHSVYMDAGTVASLKVPDGLQAPSTKNALVVPTLAGDPALKNASCLDKPPKYFAEALPTPVPKK